MKFELEEYHQGIKNEELIADLQKVAKELNKPAISRAERWKRKIWNYTGIRWFGSITTPIPATVPTGTYFYKVMVTVKNGENYVVYFHPQRIQVVVR